MKKVTFGIVGCGYIGNRHAKMIAENEFASLIAVFDSDLPKAEAMALNNRAMCCSSLVHFLQQDFSVVIVATHNSDHAVSAIEALNAGKNVLVEKPMAISSAQCKAMIEAANFNQRQLFVVMQNRFNPPVAKVKTLLDEGKLGKVHQVQLNCFWNRNEAYYKNSYWKGTKELDGGTLFTQYSHFIDILYYLLGGIKFAQGILRNTMHQNLVEYEDTGVIHFEMENGALGTLALTTNAYRQNMEGSIVIFAEKGCLKIGGKYLNTIEYQSLDGEPIVLEDTNRGANNYGYYEGSMSNHDLVIENVIQTLNGKSTIMTSAEDGLRVVEMIETFYKGSQIV